MLDLSNFYMWIDLLTYIYEMVILDYWENCWIFNPSESPQKWSKLTFLVISLSVDFQASAQKDTMSQIMRQLKRPYFEFLTLIGLIQLD